MSKLSINKLFYWSSRNLMLYSVGISSIYSGSSHLEQKLTEFIVNEENLAFFPEYSSTFLEKLKYLTKGKGTIHPAKCWRGQIISRRPFLSNLYLKSISSKSPLVRLLFKTSLKLCIYAKKLLLLIRNVQHSDVILPRQKWTTIQSLLYRYWSDLLSISIK